LHNRRGQERSCLVHSAPERAELHLLRALDRLEVGKLKQRYMLLGNDAPRHVHPLLAGLTPHPLMEREEIPVVPVDLLGRPELFLRQIVFLRLSL